MNKLEGPESALEYTDPGSASLVELSSDDRGIANALWLNPSPDNTKFVGWLKREEEVANQDQTANSRLLYQLRLAELYFLAGLINNAIDTLRAAVALAGNDQNNMTVKIEQRLDYVISLGTLS